ncbi:exodeoxyribonuclease V subunit alpha [Luteimonas aquatica]|uniref:exodeoxyribonuclease V subunit alpha n=1 Tax=Luteimonas aquatica TaxID=450364 RepID=UPI001F595E9D|nr:exodeoxyribonuclease V subunit alpha [Luteimonas aquatica]
MSLLARLRKHEALRAVDLALADTLRRLRPETDERVLAGAALASLAVAHGHAAFDPRQPHLLLGESGGDWPAAESWDAAFAASPWVSRPAPALAADPQRPLVLEGGLLYLRRYREYERRLARGLLRLAAAPVPDTGDDAVAALFAVLFPDAGDRATLAASVPDVAAPDGAAAGDRDQARAAALALTRSLLLITGGPGTGKTATIARLLLLLLAQARAQGLAAAPRIALAAPTGRAAERMAESLQQAAAVLRATPGVDPALCEALPTRAQTLHRLLGTIPDSPRFRHDADAPLPHDVVVVDEASMVDLPLMSKLVEAVPDGARLILLGDRDQLPSVEAGDVLSAIVDAADAEPAPGREAEAPTPGGGLHGHRAQLRRSYRQSRTLDLAPLALAVRAGEADTALQLLRGETLSGVHFEEGLLDPLQGPTRERLLAPWRALQDCDDPATALRLARRQRLLTALRGGPQGALALNARIEEALAGSHRPAYFHGRLLLVTENSARHGLFNGDIGVCLRDAEGETLAWFADGAGGVRHFHPAALPAHGGAFAMTVHKAQGSEFDTVWLLLPRRDARPLSRELLYTALTRARDAVHVCAGERVLRAALARRAQRVSGLAARL